MLWHVFKILRERLVSKSKKGVAKHLEKLFVLFVQMIVLGCCDNWRLISEWKSFKSVSETSTIKVREDCLGSSILNQTSDLLLYAFAEIYWHL